MKKGPALKPRSRRVQPDKHREPLAKAFKILRWMADSPGDRYGVRQIADALDMPPSTIHRLVNSLEGLGLVQKDRDDGSYGIGLEFVRIASQVSSRLPVRATALPLLQELVAACDETALLGIYDSLRMEMMYVSEIETRHPLRYAVDLYHWLPLTAGAGGLSILAFLPAEQQENLLAKPIVAFTKSTITEPEELRRQLSEIRRRGYVLTRGTRIPGAVGLGVPILGLDNHVVGAVTLTIPEQRFNEADEHLLAALLTSCGRRISERLGGEYSAITRANA
jgi:DNA-binding IclR family transcriptional regulator